MKCEQLEGFPSIVTEVHSNNPLLEKIETQLDNLSDKAEEILGAVQECCDCEGPGKKCGVDGETIIFSQSKTKILVRFSYYIHLCIMYYLREGDEKNRY